MERQKLTELLTSPDFRIKTAMYIGEKKLSTSKGFLDGFQYACAIYNVASVAEEPDFGRFHDWVAVCYGRVEDGQINSVAGWKNIILEACNEQEDVAVDRFFELYDQFRKEGTTTLSQFRSQ